jgi:tRNA (adenine37-N6)-methyltransferase
MKMIAKPIGTIRTPFMQSEGTPIQPRFAEGAMGTVEIQEEYAEGLEGLAGFDRIWLIFWCDRAKEPNLKVKPYMSEKTCGLFSTRAPSRPNPIGISCVRLLEVDGNQLRVADVDMLDGTPLLDIKPYAPRFDNYEVENCGWMDKDEIRNQNRFSADNRFEKDSKP